MGRCGVLVALPNKVVSGRKIQVRSLHTNKAQHCEIAFDSTLLLCFLAATLAQLCSAVSLSSPFACLAHSSTLSLLCILTSFPASAAACLSKTTVATALLQRTYSMKSSGKWAISIVTIHTLVRLRISLRTQSCLACVRLLRCTCL